MLLALRSLFEEAANIITQPAFGLARLFYWQREQAYLKRKKQLDQEDEELMAMIALEL